MSGDERGLESSEAVIDRLYEGWGFSFDFSKDELLEVNEDMVEWPDYEQE